MFTATNQGNEKIHTPAELIEAQQLFQAQTRPFLQKTSELTRVVVV